MGGRGLFATLKIIWKMYRKKNWIILCQKGDELSFFFSEKEISRYTIIGNYLDHEKRKTDKMEIFEA